ncbi:helix-turn-helix transcriptional regulator [Clostridium beijerinckii]|uniref:tetratricopeptide repeat protein n=1 Tax=Clostridium beijerinckii TaxID=1520 RepID=UPI00098C4F1C|nr:tetratricopeptide repeat protein [Clostridium beijerinckii]NRU41314.1 transcriptional regulator with XRE-family HTH domain [Clostridium beijerinckii]OOM65563.1 anaerobic benzoate catabolism transcriptional regulator [Clostridium beijerinckii]UYZ35783.1 helix-turn-helix transcriptional regulator [Clostridium beijerinckii]
MEILSLGEKIKRRRKQLNMTLKDLAKDRITPGQISLVESGRSNPSVDLLEYLADALNTNVEYLMESEESQAEKISLYYEQVGESCILQGDYEKGQRYIDNALYYCEKYNLEYRKAMIYFITAKSYMYKRDFPMAQKFFLSANVIFVKNNNYEQIIKTFLHLANIALELKAYHSSSSYLKQAEKVYVDNKVVDEFLMGEIYYNMARTYYDVEELDLALEYSCLARNRFEQVYNDEDYARNLFTLAEEFNKKGDLPNAIKYSKKTLEVYKKIQYNKSIVNIEHNLGKLFYELGNLDESLKHYDISKSISTQNRVGCINDILIDICKSYLKLKNTEQCSKILKDIENRIEEHDIDRKIECKLIKYTMFNIDDKPEQAESVLIDTYVLAKNSGKLSKAAELAMRVGKYFIDKKEEEEASYYLNQGIKLFNEAEKLENYKL